MWKRLTLLFALALDLKRCISRSPRFRRSAQSRDTYLAGDNNSILPAGELLCISDCEHKEIALIAANKLACFVVVLLGTVVIASLPAQTEQVPEIVTVQVPGSGQ